jgi:hypothetical protein
VSDRSLLTVIFPARLAAGLTSSHEPFIFPAMLRFLKVLAVVLVIGAISAPVESATACADSHEADCCMDCSCICHGMTLSIGRDHTGAVTDSISQQAVVFESDSLGILLAADIFRPPTLA